MTNLYVAMEGDLVIVSDRDGSWDLETHLAGLVPQCLAADPDLPQCLYCATFSEGVYKSEDAGSSWQPFNEGISYTRVTVVGVGPGAEANGGSAVYAGTEPSAVFCSEDGGEGWRELGGLTDLPSASQWSFPPKPHTHYVRFIGVDPLHPERLYVCIEAGALVRSLDGGESWEDRHPDGPRDTHTLATHPAGPGRLYSAAGDGYFESFDYGQSWRRPTEDLSHRYLWSVAVDPADPESKVVSAAHGPRQAHDFATAESAIYRRSGEGPWRQCRVGLPEPEGTLVPVLAAGVEGGEFYAATNRGLYRSQDGGESWERMEVGWPESYHTQRPRALVVTE